MNTSMIVLLAGGLGLFIFGMKMMGDGLEQAAGSRLKRLLEILTENRLMGLLVGAIVTAIVQSSSATTVMVVGFVNWHNDLGASSRGYYGCKHRNYHDRIFNFLKPN